ncbi:AraC family transcriptional regulator (plasmid) [Rhizobium sp. CB3060]|nr:AraC family transcriptional regulator [Rhizobium tropici]
MLVRETFRSHGRGIHELSAALSTQDSKIGISTRRDSAVCFECEFRSADSISIGLCSYDGAFQSLREADCGHFLIILPIRGQARFESQGKSHESFPGRASVLQGREGDLGSVKDERQHFSLLLSRDHLARRLSRMRDKPTSTRLDFEPIFDIDTGPGSLLLSLVRTAYMALYSDNTSHRSPIYVRSLTDALADFVLESIPHRYSAELGSSVASISPRHIKRAIEFMRANLARSISIHEIADSCNVSMRSLQKGFQDFHMTTPMGFLQHLRFEAVHNDLQKSQTGDTVASLAAKWGFTHVGRFSADYKRRFGQSPSTTLRQLHTHVP